MVDRHMTALLIDARGTLCPIPVLRLAKRIKDRAPGTVLELLTDDPAAPTDVEAFCKDAGHEVVDIKSGRHFATILVRKGEVKAS